MHAHTTVEDGRVTGFARIPAALNKGRACIKGMTIIEQMYHPDRRCPMRRKARERRLERITWDEAYDIMWKK